MNSFKKLLCDYQSLVIKRDNCRSGKIYLSTKDKISLNHDIDSLTEAIINYCLENFLTHDQIKLFD